MEISFFSKKLKHARKLIKMSLQELADSIGRSKAFVYQVEEGKSEPTINDLVKIANILQVKPIYLIDDNYNIGVTPHENQQCKACNKLDKIKKILRED